MPLSNISFNLIFMYKGKENHREDLSQKYGLTVFLTLDCMLLILVSHFSVSLGLFMNLAPVLTLLLIIQVFAKVDCLVQPHVCAKRAVTTELSKHEVVQWTHGVPGAIVVSGRERGVTGKSE